MLDEGQKIELHPNEETSTFLVSIIVRGTSFNRGIYTQRIMSAVTNTKDEQESNYLLHDELGREGIKFKR